MHAAPLRDIGKAVLSDQTLLHAGNLSDDECEMMQKHTYLGAEILQGGTSSSSRRRGRSQLAITSAGTVMDPLPVWKETEIPLSARVGLRRRRV